MVKGIFIKRERKQSVVPAQYLEFTPVGIIGNVPCLPLRQVLILSTDVLEEFHLSQGDLYENLVINYEELHGLPSGTILRIGPAHIHLTFHCEPCGNIKDKVGIKAILHKRGYLGRFLNQGTIRLGDDIENLGVGFSAIPYDLTERLAWYLSRQVEPVFLSQVLTECGLSLSYARALPRLLKRLPEPLINKVKYKSNKIKR